MTWTKENIPDLSGKTALVTGANSGIGYEIALALYQKGASVTVAGRDPLRVNDAIKEMSHAGGTGTLSAGILDLASLQQIREFAEQFKKEHDQLHLLINNAGVMTPPESRTEDGFELQFGVNFLGHFALTGYLYPLLKASPVARVMNHSSGAHSWAAGVDFDNLHAEHSYDASREYGISKLANLQFTAELQRRAQRAGDDILASGANPGVTESRLARYMSPEEFQAGIDKYGQLKPAWQGAIPALYAATAADVKGMDYYEPGKGINEYSVKAEMSAAANDAVQAAKLWAYAEQVTGISYP